MNYKILISSILILMTFLTSCGSNSQKDVSKKDFSLDEKKFVHNLFLTEYLWYDQVSQNIDYGPINTPQSLMNTLRVTPTDKWSFTMTQKEYENFVNQKTVGFGFGYSQDFTLFMVRIDAPAYKKLFRGDKILEVNGEAVTQERIAKASSQEGQEAVFIVLRDTQELTIRITPSNYTFKVSLGKVIQHDGKNIGYLRYDSFTESSVKEFEEIFTTFKNESISELVIDLRYNGGGSIAAAGILLDNITNAHPEKRQVYLDWNANAKNKNSTYTFESVDLQDGNELTMQRVVFLVTKNSASASELVISALKPYLGASNVITIGTQTHGKPVGMSGKVYANNYYFLINFIVRNNNNETTSFDGIPVTCTSDDNLAYHRGDKSEPMLATALHYIDNNVCP